MYLNYTVSYFQSYHKCIFLHIRWFDIAAPPVAFPVVLELFHEIAYSTTIS